MKKLVKVEEVEGEGLLGLMGETVILICEGYFYSGKLTGVNDSFVQLEEASIVFDAGEWTKNKGGKFQTKEALGRNLYVMTGKIESFMVA